ncbi:MAG: hypothetical protein JSS74_15815, partial [Actinobacteria bacterium]|nr:hypothetical protein [Actinomycetota bacterium]
LQSTAGVITSLPIMEVMPWVAIPQPTIRVVSGGRIHQVQAHPSGRVFGAVVELDQPLVPGATTLLETEVEFSPDGPPVQETGNGVGRAIRELLIWVRFTPGFLPHWCNLVEDLPGEPIAVQPFPLGRGGAAHVVRAPFGPGALGVHWGMSGDSGTAAFSTPRS